jgi:uncharacterized protein (TIGR02453 family)
MAETRGIFSQDIFRFFREMGRNNHKSWMDANRERYRSTVVEPFRALLERLVPAARKLNSQFVTSGRVGDNFSRINRDIRFARDKSPYRAQMYLFFAEPSGEGGQLYVGISAETVTCGFRIYSSGRTSPLIEIARPRGMEHAQWIEGQRRRLRKKCESYWYSTEKSEWTKHNGWPGKPEEWKRLQAWIVRKRFEPAVVTRRAFEWKVAKTFREVYPLYPFTTLPKWKP